MANFAARKACGLMAAAPARLATVRRGASDRGVPHAHAHAPRAAALRAGVVVRASSVAEIEAIEGVEYEKQDYAVVELGGHQLIVEEGFMYDTDRIDAEVGSVIELNRVLLVKQQESGKLHLGKPYVEGATVEAEVVRHKKAKKVVVFKMQPKKHTRSKNGHRQPETVIKITKIAA